MKYKDLLLGMILGFLITYIGVVIFLQFFTSYDPFSDLQLIKNEGILGKVITLGAILNFIVFFVLLKKNKELMARGIVLSMILITVFTLFL